MVEKRKFKRLDTSKIEVAWKKESLPSSASLSKNISAGGICLILDNKDALNEGDFLNLEFKLPTSECISAKGRVAWSEEIEIVGRQGKSREAGIEFIDISDNVRQSISQFVFSALRT